MKKTIILIISLMLTINVSKASPIEDFAEISAMYIGTCIGLDYLKKNYCSSSSLISPKTCVNQTISLLPTKNQNEFASILKNQFNDLNQNATNGVDKGFAKVLVLVKNDSEKACFGYASSMNTMRYEKFEQLKQIAKQIK